LPTVHARTLKRAAEIIGGEEELARRLIVTPSHLELWIRGLESPPVDVFLKAVDIVTENDLPQMTAK
jgi:DNA-binding transcriptional regulator YdaS (Cro superfamily)